MDVILTEDQQKHLSRLLQREIEVARALNHSLELEYEALSRPDSGSALEAIVREKQDKVTALETIGKHREAQLAALGVLRAGKHPGEVGHIFNNSQHLAELWSELLSVATECQAKNRINGGIVDLGVRHSKHALDILRGTVLGYQPGEAVYDHSGRTASAAEKHPIARA